MNTPVTRHGWLRIVGAALALITAGAAPRLGAAPQAQEKRVYMIGNSLTDQVLYDAFQRLAESRGHKHIWGRSMTPGAPISWHWANKPSFTQGPFGDFRKAFAEYQWDAVTLQPFSSFGVELDAAKKMVDLVKVKSPQAQVYVYSQWMGSTKGDFDALFTLRQEKPSTSTQGIRQFYELFLADLAAANPDMKAPRLIPAGHALYLFNQKIQAGQVPGLTSIWEIYNDGIHLGNIGCYFVACSFYATIYGDSPVGLPYDDYNRERHGRGDRAFTPELARIIQETVWETVTGHAALTGVSAPETPPAIVSPRLATAVEKNPYEFQLLAAYGEPPLQWKLASGKLPDGFSLSSEGVLSGTAGAAGTTKLVFEVADRRGRVAKRELMLVTEPDLTPKIVDATVPAAPVGVYLEHQIKSESGNGALTWVLAKDAALPPGLALSTTGSIRGTPVRAGDYSFEVEARDSDAVSPETARKALTMRVTEGGPELVYAAVVPDKAVTLDGALDEPVWKLDHKIVKVVEGVPTGVSGRFGVLVAGGTLLIGVEVTDPSISENAANPSAGDSVEVYLDLFNNRETTYNADDRRITVTPSGKLEVVGSRRVLGARAKRTATGYTVEVSLPSYNTQVKLNDTAIGLDVGINDVKDGRRTRFVWRGTENNDTDPSHFGTVIVLTPEEAKESKKKK